MNSQNVNYELYEDEPETAPYEAEVRPQSNHSNLSNMHRNSQKSRNSHNNSQAFYEDEP